MKARKGENEFTKYIYGLEDPILNDVMINQLHEAKTMMYDTHSISAYCSYGCTLKGFF